MNRNSIASFLFMGMILFLLAGPTRLNAQKPDWSVFSSQVGGVKMKFPAKPEVENKKSEHGAAYTATAYLGENIYILTFLIHDTRLSDHEDLARAAITGFLEASGGDQMAEREFKYKKHRGREAWIDIADQGIEIKYRVMLVGQIQYQFMAVNPSGNPTARTTKKFFKSFKLMQ